jgi:hypothetical protein
MTLTPNPSPKGRGEFFYSLPLAILPEGEGKHLTHGMLHPFPTDEMKMQVEDGLPAVCTGINDDAVTALVNVLLRCDLASHHEHVADQRLVLNF